MAFPTVTASTEGNAQAAFQSACNAAGLQLGSLNAVSQLQLALANLLDYDPTTQDVPAGNIVPGTFAANTASPTGAFIFTGNLTVGASTFVVTAATGNVGVGAAASSDVALRVLSSGIATAGQYGIVSDCTFSSAATTTGVGILARVNTAAAAYTMTDARALYILAPSIGAASAITNVYGLYIGNQSGGATLNYAIYTNAGLIRFGDAVTMASSLAITGALTGVTTSAFSGDMNIGSGKFVVTAATGAVAAGGYTRHGDGAWPTVSVGLSGSRAGFISATEDEIFIIANMNTASTGAVGINYGGALWLGARGTDNAANMAFAEIIGARESAVSGTLTTYLSFKTMNAVGARNEALRLASTGAAIFASSIAITGALTGVTTLATSGAITSDGGVQTFGANDSGGAGKRLVLVPNV